MGNLNLGWRYDHNIGEWHQIDGYNIVVSSSHATTTSAMENSQENEISGVSVSNVLTNHEPKIFHLEQNLESTAELWRMNGRLGVVLDRMKLCMIILDTFEHVFSS